MGWRGFLTVNKTTFLIVALLISQISLSSGCHPDAMSLEETFVRNDSNFVIRVGDDGLPPLVVPLVKLALPSI